ncbi:MAG: hypothetical protein FJ291_24030 [Planctomycetes bacterium]|nr:hypothetical protein [Planctomycetota bacterium]
MASAAETWPQGLRRVREPAATPLILSGGGPPRAQLVALSEDELVTNAADWLAAHAGIERAKKALAGAGQSTIVAAVGEAHPLIKRLVAAGKLHLEPRVGPQGFVVERVSDAEAGELLVCWSPSPLGCRYGLLEVLRSLRVEGKRVTTDLARVVERPQFPMRICYLNFAEHLQNAYNPNLLFDSPVNRWSREDWERFIDMLSACRYNVFEFWLVPTLFSPEALKGGKIQADFAETMNHAIAYARRRGVAVHPIQAVNTVGQNWHYHCPNDPKERAEIIALWDHWSRALKGNDYIGFFPGDPGGCTKNGCTPETFVDLCLELAKVVKKNNPSVAIEVNTWGEPFGGWGVPLWTGKPERTATSMRYFLGKLPQLPPGTFTSINLGFSPDAHPDTHGGDGRPWAKEAAKLCPVLTWDYSVTEGESTVFPHCRIRRIFERRREELALGCYSGGICYTMSPRINCLSIFACAEAWWNPAQEPAAVLRDYGRLVFGDELADIGPLLEEFEVIPDWGHYPPFPYSPQRLEKAMARLIPLLEKAKPDAAPRLPLAPTIAEYRKSLLFFADLFAKLAATATSLDEAAALAKASGKLPAGHKALVSLGELEELLADPADFPQKARLRELAERLRKLDVRALTKSYWDTVYGIYGVIPHPVDPRAQGATTGLFRRFNAEYALVREPSPLEKALKATGKPFLLVKLGDAIGERGWKLNGWAASGEHQGETWRASFDAPGTLARDDFADKGYSWLVVRLTEGPKGGKKTIAVNGQQIGEFVRTGPPREQKAEWWVTRSYPIPEGLLKPDKLEVRFGGFGIAIAAVALSAAPIQADE